MKAFKNSLFTIVLCSTLSAFAGKGDATPSKMAALKLATGYAVDVAFGNILDESSSVQVLPAGTSGGRYVFKATARNAGLPDCVVEILVSSETGMVFQDNVEACQNLQ